MDDSVLKVEKSDGVLTLTLHRPAQMNALNAALRRALQEAIEAADADADVSVVILTGAGKAFCAGLDLKELGGEVQSDATVESAVTGNALTRSLAALRKPLIGAINGAAITGGFELALACDVLVVSKLARFADTHARVGVMPGWGLSQRLPRLIGIYRAKELSLTGNFLGADQAERWGLVNRVVEPEALWPTCHGLARDMLSCDPETLLSMKRVIDRGFDLSFEEGLRVEAAASRDHAKRLRPEEVASRRAAIQARGRTQSEV